jgi:hypothetical protein
MNLDFNLIVGLLAVVYGVYSFIQRKVAPENIEKLQTMIERNGEKMAHSIHLVGYTIFLTTIQAPRCAAGWPRRAAPSAISDR